MVVKTDEQMVVLFLTKTEVESLKCALNDTCAEDELEGLYSKKTREDLENILHNLNHA